MWQKTYRICLRNSKLTPHEVIAIWKQNVPNLKPPQKRFFPSSTGITPNALVLIDAQTPGGPISTGVMVLYAGAESFTLMTPAGHPEAGWVTFSSYIEDGCTFAQVQVLARASDPLYEVAFRLAGDKLQDQIWTHVLTALATLAGTSGEVADAQDTVGPQAPVEASPEHLVQRSAANPVFQPDRLAAAGSAHASDRRVGGGPSGASASCGIAQKCVNDGSLLEEGFEPLGQRFPFAQTRRTGLPKRP